MTRTIYKYQLQIIDTQFIAMPQGAEILSVQMQHGELCVWALCGPNNPIEERMIEIYGTGHPVEVDSARKFIGTVQQREGFLVWHVFESPR